MDMKIGPVKAGYALRVKGHPTGSSKAEIGRAVGREESLERSENAYRAEGSLGTKKPTRLIQLHCRTRETRTIGGRNN